MHLGTFVLTGAPNPDLGTLFLCQFSKAPSNKQTKASAQSWRVKGEPCDLFFPDACVCWGNFKSLKSEQARSRERLDSK